MSLSNRELQLVRGSLDKLRHEFDVRSMFFYEKLFERAPNLKSMFRDDLAGQGMKFMSTLNEIANDLGNPDALRERLVELGDMHISIGVKPADFKPMEEALIDTMREALGKEFTPEMETAWRTAYEEVQAVMLGGGRPKLD